MGTRDGVPRSPALYLGSPKRAAGTLWVGGPGCLGAGSRPSRPRPLKLAPPRPLRGVLRVKRRAGWRGCTCVTPGQSAAATGRADCQALRAGLGYSAPGARTSIPTSVRPGTPTPTRPSPAPAPAPRADGLLLPQFVRLVRGGHGSVRLRRLRRLQPAWRLPIQPLAACLPRSGAALPRARLLQLRAWRPTRPPARALLGR